MTAKQKLIKFVEELTPEESIILSSHLEELSALISASGQPSLQDNFEQAQQEQN